MFSKLKNRKAEIIGHHYYKKYAVIVPYLEPTDSILFEVRASTLRNQPNEICFPGGHIEEQELPLEAALREFEEELLMDSNKVEVIAPLNIYLFPYAMEVHPFLGVIKELPTTFQKEEVSEIFTVPFSFFLEQEPKVYYNTLTVQTEEHFPYDLLGMEEYPWRKAKYPVLFYQYQGRVIWGMTAHFIYNLVNLYKNSK